MIRKSVLLFLAFGVMLSHLTAAPHLHTDGANSSATGDTRPHFHFSQFSSRITGAPSDVPVAPKVNHDADAWYLDDAAIAADVSDSTGTDAGQVENVFATAQFAFVLVDHPDRTTAPTPAWPLVCPLFVQHRALLI